MARPTSIEERKREVMLFKLNRAKADLHAVAINLHSKTIDDDDIVKLVQEIVFEAIGLQRHIPQKLEMASRGQLKRMRM
jgi:hypothetical protein